jgi:hypothetical protein
VVLHLHGPTRNHNKMNKNIYLHPARLPDHHQGTQVSTRLLALLLATT